MHYPWLLAMRRDSDICAEGCAAANRARNEDGLVLPSFGSLLLFVVVGVVVVVVVVELVRHWPLFGGGIAADPAAATGRRQ
jgi:hypothetical protein